MPQLTCIRNAKPRLDIIPANVKARDVGKALPRKAGHEGHLALVDEPTRPRHGRDIFESRTSVGAPPPLAPDAELGVQKAAQERISEQGGPDDVPLQPLPARGYGLGLAVLDLAPLDTLGGPGGTLRCRSRLLDFEVLALVLI